MAGENTDTRKIQTRFPGLHNAMGTDPSRLEVLDPVVGGEDKGAAGAGDAGQTQEPPVGVTATKEAAGQTQEAADVAVGNEADVDSWSDDQKNAMLAKLTKGKVKSLDELTPPKAKSKEEQDAEAEQARQDAISWAFETGKVKRADYDTAVVLKSKTDRELALMAFTNSLREENSEITEGEAEEMFKDAYHEGQSADSPLFAIGQKEIKKLASAFRQEKVSVLDQIVPEYEGAVATQQQYKAYKKTVKSLAEAHPKELEFSLNHTNVDGTPATLKYKVAVDQKIIDKVVSEMTTDQSFSVRNIAANGNFKEKDLSDEILYHVKARAFDTAMADMLAANTVEVEKRVIAQLGNKMQGVNGLNNGQQRVPATNPEGKVNTYPGLNEAAKKYSSATRN